MSEDKTQDIQQRYDTKPTLETILEELRAMRTSIENKLENVESRLEGFENRLENFDVRLDRIESVASQTRAEMLTLRADFREFISRQKEVA